MPTIVDALLVTLGLDTKDYEKNTKKAEKTLDEFSKKQEDAKKKNTDTDRKKERERQKQFKEEQHQNKETVEALNKIRNQMLGVIGVFTAGQSILNFAKNAVFGAAAMGRLGENTKMSVEEIAGFDQALQRIGGTSEEAMATIENLSGELAKYKMGMESNIVQYVRWNGGTQHGELDNTKNLLMGMADSFERLNKMDPSKALMLAKSMGISTNTFNLLKQGRRLVQEQIRDGAHLSGINKGQVEEAQRAQKAWVDMAAHLASVGRAVLFPILKAISDWMSKHKANIHIWIDKLRDAIAKFTPETLDKVGDALDKIYTSIMLIIDAIQKANALANKFGLGITDDKDKKPVAPENKSFTGKYKEFLGQTPQSSVMKAYIQGLMTFALGINKLMPNSSTSSSHVSVGQITVQGASDPAGSAKAVKSALSDYSGIASQANSGVVR